MRGFYAALAGVVGGGSRRAGWMLTRPRTVSIPANVTVQAADTAGFRGYLLGSDGAKLEITEYADYQCPSARPSTSCNCHDHEHATHRLGAAALALSRFPLQQHSFSRLAAALGCVRDEQGKYWDQHRRIYEGQQDWAELRDAGPDLPGNTLAANGLDLGRYDSCMGTAKYSGRIEAGYDEGVRVGITARPTLLIGAVLPGTARFRRRSSARGLARASMT